MSNPNVITNILAIAKVLEFVRWSFKKRGSCSYNLILVGMLCGSRPHKSVERLN